MTKLSSSVPQRKSAPVSLPDLHCALVGESIGYSYSKEIHDQLGLYDYALRSVPRKDFAHFMKTLPYQGMNVTIPY